MTGGNGYLLPVALEWLAAGYAPLPIGMADKHPCVSGYHGKAAAPAGEDMVRAWFGNGSGAGLGAATGCGGLEMFELEGHAVAEGVLEKFKAGLAARGLMPLWERIVTGYSERSPSGGFHVCYRVSDGAVPGSTRLAQRPETAAELGAREMTKVEARKGVKKTREIVQIETRGTGGFTVLAPTAKNGGKGAWQLLSGGPGTLALVTTAEREALWEAARACDTYAAWKAAQRPLAAPPAGAEGGGTATAEAPSAALAFGPWPDIMEPAGWAYVREDDQGHQQWRRPGKDTPGISATTSEGGGLYVFSSSTEFDAGVPYSKAAAVAVLHEWMDADKALAKYGTAEQSRQAAQDFEMPSGRMASEAAAERLAKAEAAVPGRKGKPRFQVNNEAIAAEHLRSELGRGPLGGVYLRDGLLVHTPRVGEDGYVMPAPDEVARGVDHGPAQVRPVGVPHVRALVEVVYDVGMTVAVKDGKGKKTGEETWMQALFPADAARHAVSAAELGIGCPNLRHLAGVTHTPVLRPDGTVLSAPGHDEATGLLYLPDRGLSVPAVPEHPDGQQVAAAAAALRQPVSRFPWVAPHHEANYLGAMFTPLLRLLLGPPYPMLIITATNAGSGKTLLMRMLGIVHGIATRGEFPREREELRKLIISTLHTTTAPVIGLDNVRGTIYSSELEALLTARTLTDRELGASRNITVANDRLWVATGNNARIGGDMARRCLPVALDPRCADPYKRRFSFDPAEQMTAGRGEYIAALLTVARGWVLAGAPREDPGRSDDYAAWYGALRGLLKWAGVPGVFGASAGDLSTVSEDDGEWGVFVAELDRVFSDESFTTADIIAHLDRAVMPPVPRAVRSPMEEFMDDTPHVAPGVRIAPDCLPGELAEKWGQVRYEKTSGFARSLGKWLSYRDGRFTADGLTVRMQPGRRARFTVEGAG